MATPALHPVPPPEPDEGEHVLQVTLAGPHGARWTAVGVGATVADAILAAIEAAPTDVAWLVTGWRDVYGD